MRIGHMAPDAQPLHGLERSLQGAIELGAVERLASRLCSCGRKPRGQTSLKGVAVAATCAAERARRQDAAPSSAVAMAPGVVAAETTARPSPRWPVFTTGLPSGGHAAPTYCWDDPCAQWPRRRQSAWPARPFARARRPHRRAHIAPHSRRELVAQAARTRPPAPHAPRPVRTRNLLREAQHRQHREHGGEHQRDGGVRRAPRLSSSAATRSRQRSATRRRGCRPPPSARATGCASAAPAARSSARGRCCRRRRSSGCR
jgi:hypothetical protein